MLRYQKGGAMVQGAADSLSKDRPWADRDEQGGTGVGQAVKNLAIHKVLSAFFRLAGQQNPSPIRYLLIMNTGSYFQLSQGGLNEHSDFWEGQMLRYQKGGAMVQGAADPLPAAQVEPAPFQQTHILPVMVAEQHHHCRNRQDHQNQFFQEERVEPQIDLCACWRSLPESAVFWAAGSEAASRSAKGPNSLR